MSAEIKDVVTEYGKKLREQIESLGGTPYTKAGILEEEFKEAKEGEAGGNAPTLGDVAVYNEFGTKTIPARSFIRSTADEQREKWGEFAAHLVAQVIDLKVGAFQMFELQGLRMQRDIQAKIRSNIPPANAPSTVMRKLAKVQGAAGERLRTAAGFAGGMQSITDSGAVKTLIDTGQLHGSVNYAVVRNGTEKRGETKKGQ